jgi:hypothetical protein
MKPVHRQVSLFDLLLYHSLGESFMNVGHSWKRQILFQRLEVKMSQLIDLLRGPALGVVFMILLLAGVIIVTAFAALIAQLSLLLRLKPWNIPQKPSEGVRSETGQSTAWQAPLDRRSATSDPRQQTTLERQRTPRVVVFEPNANEVVDAVWWQEVR